MWMEEGESYIEREWTAIVATQNEHSQLSAFPGPMPILAGSHPLLLNKRIMPALFCCPRDQQLRIDSLYRSMHGSKSQILCHLDLYITNYTQYTAETKKKSLLLCARTDDLNGQ